MLERRNLERTLLIGLFLGTITIWPVLTFALGTTSVLGDEKRIPAQFPAFSWDRQQLAKLPGNLEACFNDRLALRTLLVACRNFLKYRFLGVSGSHWITVGRDNWLFNRASIEHGKNKYFTDTELAAWQGYFEETNRWLDSRGIRYLLVVVPSKESAYPEQLPPGFATLARRPWVDQLIERLRSRTSLAVLDLRDTIRENKWRGPLYHRWDTHWNSLGAFVGYQTIIRRLRDWYPDMLPLDFSDVAIKSGSYPYADLMKYLGIRWLMTESVPDVVPKVPRRALVSDNPPCPDFFFGRLGQRSFATEIKNSTLPRAVMFRDSMTIWLQPFLSEHFSRIYYYWRFPFSRALVEAEKPDIVIEEVSEYTAAQFSIENDLEALLAEHRFFQGSVVYSINTAEQLQKNCQLVACSLVNNGLPTINADNRDPAIILPVIDQHTSMQAHSPARQTMDTGHWTLRVELSVPDDTAAQIFYTTAGDPIYDGRKCITLRVRKGHNVLYIPLPPGVHGRPRLDPGYVTGHYVVHSLSLSRTQ